MDDRMAGIVIEVISKKLTLGKQRYLTKNEGHITSCIILTKGQVYDAQFGLEFIIDKNKDAHDGEINETFFRLPWTKILEVRTLDGRVLYRNWYLCPTCRRITKFFLASGEPFCRHCEHKISVKENREICISPFEEN